MVSCLQLLISIWDAIYTLLSIGSKSILPKLVVWRLDFFIDKKMIKDCFIFLFCLFFWSFYLVCFWSFMFAISLWWRPGLWIKDDVKKMLKKKQILITSNPIGKFLSMVFKSLETTLGKCWKTFIKGHVIRNQVFFNVSWNPLLRCVRKMNEASSRGNWF